MKAMKNISVVNRMLGKKRAATPDGVRIPTEVDANLDTPEANATRSIKLFCESGGPNSTQGEEVIHLPTIIEAAESSPVAAQTCAVILRRFLKDNYSKPHVQYNALMLVRILADNPGQTFTRNIDAKFVDTTKQLLRNGRDMSVRQILTETLSTFEREKSADQGLALLLEMWKTEQVKIMKAIGPNALPAPRAPQSGSYDAHSQNYFSRPHHRSRRLPEPRELAQRLEEARTSASLLTQLVQSTPPSEVLSHELIQEFSARCQSASRSCQAYMQAEEPAPDNDTMATLIETNDLLSAALSKYQRATLNARKVLGLGAPSAGVSPNENASSGPVSSGANGDGTAAPRPNQVTPPVPSRPVLSVSTENPRQRQVLPPEAENPFGDEHAHAEPAPPPAKESKSKAFLKNLGKSKKDKQAENTGMSNGNSNANQSDIGFENEQRLAMEPFHPGFNGAQSYSNGRQEGATENSTMYAGPSSAEAAHSTAPAHKSTAGGGVHETQRELYDDDSEEEEQVRQPVYRY